MNDLKKYWFMILPTIILVVWSIRLEGKVIELDRRVEAANLVQMKSSIVKIETDVEWIKRAMAQTFEIDIKAN